MSREIEVWNITFEINEKEYTLYKVLPSYVCGMFIAEYIRLVYGDIIDPLSLNQVTCIEKQRTVVDKIMPYYIDQLPYIIKHVAKTMNDCCNIEEQL